MTNKLRAAGNTTINAIALMSFSNPKRVVDIRPNFLRIVFNESMMSPFMFGHVDIAEPSGMLYSTITERSENLPHIRGEELLYIEYTDHNDQQRKETYFVYAITDIGLMDGKDTAMQYRLHFSSVQKAFSDKYLIQKAYRNMSYSEMVKSIFQEYYIDKPKEVLSKLPGKDFGQFDIRFYKGCEIEKTEERHTLVIPSLRPEAAIQFIMRRAYSEQNKSSLFFFFESRDRFWFVTHEQLVARNKPLIQDPSIGFTFNVAIGGDDSSPAGQLAARSTIRNATLGGMDSVESMKSQAYSRSIGEIDLLNRNVQLYYYDYKKDYLGYNNIDTNPQLPNSEEYIEAATGDKLQIPDNYVFKDYLSPEEGDSSRFDNYDRTMPRYLETLATKPVFSYHFQKHHLTGTIAGRHFMCPGFMLKTVAPEYTIDSMVENRPEDNYFNGNQMVVSAYSTIEDDYWTQNIVLSKGIRGGGTESNRPGSAAGVSQITGVDRDGDGLDDTTGQSVGFTGGRSSAIQPSRSQAEAEKEAMDFFTGLNTRPDGTGNPVYTEEQAAGIVANLTRESGMNEYAINPNDAGAGKDSIGLGQWNRDRLDNLNSFAEARGETEFEIVNGNRVPSFRTQLAFVDHELRGSDITGAGNGSESRAYDRLIAANNTTDAAVAMTTYERFKGYRDGLSGSAEVRGRASDATRILEGYS